MEPDRYKQNHMAYVIGLICLLSSIGLFAFSLFLMPYLFFDWHYNVSGFVIEFTTMLQEHYGLSKSGVAWAVCFALDFPAVILFLVADILSNRIDKQIYGLANSRPSTHNNVDNASTQEETSVWLIVKIILLILVVFIVARFFNVSISNNP